MHISDGYQCGCAAKNGEDLSLSAAKERAASAAPSLLADEAQYYLLLLACGLVEPVVSIGRMYSGGVPVQSFPAVEA
jgi:hypothetical protein